VNENSTATTDDSGEGRARPPRKSAEPLTHSPFANIHDVLRKNGLRPPRIISTPPPSQPVRRTLNMMDHTIHTVHAPTNTDQESLPEVPEPAGRVRIFNNATTRKVLITTLSVGCLAVIAFGVRQLLRRGGG